MEVHLYPIPSLWKCVAMYASLLTDENLQMEEYKSFLTFVTKPAMRKEMMERARFFLPANTDLSTVKLLLDEAYGPLTPDEIKHLSDDDMKKRMNLIQWTLFYPEHRFDAIWYANIFIRQLLLQQNDSEGKYISFAQEFLEKHFPRDSIQLVHEYYNTEDTIADMDDTQAEETIKDIHSVTEEHEALCFFVDANTAYGVWRMSLARSTNDIKQAFSKAALPSYLQTDKKHMLNAVELEIATKSHHRDRARKVHSATQTVIEAAYNAEQFLERILKYPGGWLVRSDIPDENHRDELKDLRKLCLPQTVFLWNNLCVEMGNWMKSIMSTDGAEHLFDENDDTEIFHAQYWYRKSLSLASIVAKDEFGIHQTFSNEEMKQFMHNMRETGLKLLKLDGTITLDSNVGENRESMDV